MMNKLYLLDTNIIIKFWKENSKILESIEKFKEIDYKIPHAIAIELSQKEFNKFNGMPILSDKFMALLPHILPEESLEEEDFQRAMRGLDKKISRSDFVLINTCLMNKEYILVTEDKKLQEAAKEFIEPSRVLDFHSFKKEIGY